MKFRLFCTGHWMMSYQCPCLKQIRVYDSLSNLNHFKVIKKQLPFFYETEEFEVLYCDTVSQQSTSFPCGVYASAYATLCALHELPETVQLSNEACLRLIFYFLNLNMGEGHIVYNELDR